MNPDEILALRERRSWTQQELAKLCGVTTRTIRKWERRGAHGAASRLLKMIEAVSRPAGVKHYENRKT